jgi:Plavaka transposase
MTIGNIPKDIRRKPTQRAQMLMGYIPTTKLKHIKNKAARRRALANLFHACMHKILSPIESYGETGIAMVTGDGVWHRCHPILATFIGDYPEQSLVACTQNGRCPKCTVPRGELGSHESFPLRDIQGAMDVFSLCDSDATAFHAASRQANLKPTYHPFWERLPFTDIFLSITPDILHQLHQGVVKHLVRWLAVIAPDEIDARCSCLPPNHNARHFYKGITELSKLTGQEHKDICRIILGLVVDLPDIQFSARLARAVRALLDFIYLSQSSVHTTESLDALETALRQFHEEKDVFIELGARQDFNLPKLHSMSHYQKSITLFGTTDNYNTEQTERLHIDYLKNAFNASNFKEVIKQMVAWIERYEAMHQRAALLRLREDPSTPIHHPSYYSSSTLYPFLTIHPSEKAVSFENLSNRYGAIDFQDALADFIVQHNYPGLSTTAARRRADNTLIPFQHVSVFHKIKFANCDDSHTGKSIVDVIHVRPEVYNQRGSINPGRFDTGLAKNGSGLRVAQIRIVFQLSSTVASSVFLPSRPAPPAYLTYVEWFSPPSTPDPSHRMCRITRQFGSHGRRSASVIPLTDILRSVQLFPVFGPVASRVWKGATVLEECQSFYVNPFLDKHMYQNFSVISRNL